MIVNGVKSGSAAALVSETRGSPLCYQWVTRTLQKEQVRGAPITYFACKVEGKGQDPAIRGLMNQIKGSPQSCLSRPSYCDKLNDPRSDDHMGICQYRDEEYGECGCPAFDRTHAPHIRKAFEDYLVRRAGEVIQKGTSTLSITIFGSGLFSQERALLIPLIDRLQQEKWKGTIRLNCISYKYSPTANFPPESTHPSYGLFVTGLVGGVAIMALGLCIAESQEDKSQRTRIKVTFIALGMLFAMGCIAAAYHGRTQKEETAASVDEIKMVDKNYPDDFEAGPATTRLLSDLRRMLPSSIQLELGLFHEAADYRRLCQVDPRFRYDLLGCIDGEMAATGVKQLLAKTNRPEAHEAILWKEKDGVKANFT